MSSKARPPNKRNQRDDPAGLSPKRIRAKSQLVHDLMAFVRRYVVMPRPELLVVTLYIIHTYAIEVADQTPYLSVKSPDKQCGKSRLLEVLELLAAGAWLAITPSEAVLYRTIDANTPTLLLDEVDTIFNPKSTSDRYEPHRALLNAGHRRGAKVPRMVGTTSLVEFSPFCPKVLAGIGALPDTIADRSIPIRLERKLPTETIDRFHKRTAEPVAQALVKQVQKWLTPERRSALRDARPLLPDQLSDRMQESCEPLLAIADELNVGDEARMALVEICTEERLDDQTTMRLRLLRDIKAIFEERDSRNGYRVRGIKTTALLRDLCNIEEAPWANYYGRGLEARDLSSLLSHYNIGPKPLKIKGEVVKGYKRDHLHAVWERYL